MTRVARYILNGLTVLSLVLLLTTLVFWVRSHRTREMLVARFGDYHYGLESTDDSAIVLIFFGRWRDGGTRLAALSAPADDDLRANRVFPLRYFVSTPGRRPSRFEFLGVGGAWGWGQVSEVGSLDWSSPINQAYTIYHGSVGAYDWDFAILFALLPAGRLSVRLFAARRKRQRLRQGRCVGCGYDLRSTPERCPECGKVAAEVNA